LFCECFAEVLRQLNRPNVSREPLHSPIFDPVFRAVAYIEENFTENIQLGVVAAHVALSPKYLASMFKRATGFTVKEYLTDVRIRKVKILLAYRSLTLSDVAMGIDFSSVLYLSRRFRNVVGVALSRCREAYEKTASP